MNTRADAAGAAALDPVARRRLRWRARRGLLENDILITRFLDHHGDSLSTAQVLALEALLDLPDNELLDLLLARSEPAPELGNDPVRSLLVQLRAA